MAAFSTKRICALKELGGKVPTCRCRQILRLGNDRPAIIAAAGELIGAVSALPIAVAYFGGVDASRTIVTLEHAVGAARDLIRVIGAIRFG